MTLYQFYEYDQEEQEALLKQATFLAERKDRHYRYELFQLYSFYLEVKYSMFYNIKKDFFAFEDTEMLKPYLAEISIRDVL